MRQLTTLQIWIMNSGAFLILASLLCKLFLPIFPALAYPVTYLAGAMAFGCMQMRQNYSGTSLTIKRLRHIQVTADLLFIATGFFMLLPHMGIYHIPVLNITTWRNEWLVLLIIATVLETYSLFRLSYELNKMHDA